MRRLTDTEKADLRARCKGLTGAAALMEGGRWMSEHLIMHWTSEDIRSVLNEGQNGANFGTRTKRRQIMSK